MKKSDITQQKIISSAEILFYSQGMQQTTQQEIANLAGVNRGLIHHYFGSKQAIALLISRRFTGLINTTVNKLYFQNEPDMVYRSITQGRILFQIIFNNRNLERFLHEEVYGRIAASRETDTPVYRDFCQECAYLGLNFSADKMQLYSMAISGIEQKLLAVRTNRTLPVSVDDILEVYNRIHLSILGYGKAEQDELLARVVSFSKRVSFVNNGNFEVKPEYFTLDA